MVIDSTHNAGAPLPQLPEHPASNLSDSLAESQFPALPFKVHFPPGSALDVPFFPLTQQPMLYQGVVLICIFQMTNKCKHLFMCLLAIGISSSYFLPSSLWLHRGASVILVPRMNPWPLQWKCGVLTTDHLGGPKDIF